MVRPTQMKLFTVTAGPARSIGLDADLGMRVQLTASASVVWAATGTPMIAFLEDVSALDGQQLSITLPDPDQDGFIDADGNTVRGFTYTADTVFTLKNRIVGRASKTFTHHASDPTTLDLDTLIPVGGSTGIRLAVPVPVAALLDGDELVLTTVDGIEMFRGNVRGPRGYLGPHGNSIDVGHGPPTAAGSYVNSYLDVDSGDLYRWSTSASSWGTPIGNLRGPASSGFDGGTEY